MFTNVSFMCCVLCLSFANCDIFGAKQLIRVLEPPHKNIGYNYEAATTTSSSLPEIIVNKKTGVTRNNQGYRYDTPSNSYLPPDKPITDEYVTPQSPPFSDEYPSIDNEYLPPNNPVFSDPPLMDYLPPPINQQDEAFINFDQKPNGYNYEPPSPSPQSPQADAMIEDDKGYRYDPPSNLYLPPVPGGRSLKEPKKSALRLQMNELRCLPNNGGYFKAVMTIQSYLESVPLVDNDGMDLSGCNIKIIKTHLVIKINSEDFNKCGVQSCGNGVTDLCLRLRFPLIRGMKTINDPILTIQCKTQRRVVSKTHALRLAVANNVQGRSASTFAHGGTQLPFRSQLGIFRRVENGGSFTRTVDPGGTVLLGEDLLLKAQIRAGDGWNYTRLSDIVMQRISSSGDVLNSATIVTSNGCVNPSMKSICAASPVFDPPLGHRLGFKAAMFQGMKSGDEMVLNVKVVGCVDKRDCILENSCETTRTKRSINKSNEEISSISFRVELPSEVSKIVSATISNYYQILTIGIIVSIVSTSLLVLMYILYTYRKKDYLYESD